MCVKGANIARLHCRKSAHKSKKFDLQTVSPCERVGSGDETSKNWPTLWVLKLMGVTCSSSPRTLAEVVLFPSTSHADPGM